MTTMGQDLEAIWTNSPQNLVVGDGDSVSIHDVLTHSSDHMSCIEPGDVVSLEGEVDSQSFANFIHLMDRGSVVMPLASTSASMYPYYHEAGLAQWHVKGNSCERIAGKRKHSLLDQVRDEGSPGLILFSTGTTGRPKAILHDFSRFIRRYRTPRPSQTTLGFLSFDHIGGINTLLHAAYNRGTIVRPGDRSPEDVLRILNDFGVEVLPTTPTFLRLLLLAGRITSEFPKSVRVVTYGTERMDEATLKELCELLPDVDFRQTYGMSELGILRVKSRQRDSLFMKVGGEGVETRVVNDTLHIRARDRMLGYLNSPSPFDAEGWYDTGDVVEVDDGYIKIIGRDGDVINVGGLKLLPSEVEQAALSHPDVAFAKAFGVDNPITGQHVEIRVQPRPGTRLTGAELRTYLHGLLPPHMRPMRVEISDIAVSHRFKRL